MRKPTKLKDQALPRPGENSDMDGSVLARLAALKAMSVNELKEKWASLFATAAPNNSRAFFGGPHSQQNSGTELWWTVARYAAHAQHAR